MCKLGRHTAVLDGDNLRHGINRDLGFTTEARVENMRRVTEIAAVLVDAGLITLLCLISPFRAEREMARQRLEAGEFIEVHIATPLSDCESRDPKGLYRRARAGELSNFTGVDQTTRRPSGRRSRSTMAPDAASELIVNYLREHHYL